MLGHVLLRSLLLPVLLAVGGCDGDLPVSDDDDTAAAESCAEGFVLDPDLPTEFLADYPDGCVPDACGIGRWGNVETDGDTVYVDAASIGVVGGSEDRPFASIQEGLDAAGEAGGGRVAVAAGTYAEALVLDSSHDGVQLAGRCAELVVLDAAGEDAERIGIYAEGSFPDTVHWSVSALTVTGAPYAGVFVFGGQMELQDARLVENGGFGAIVLDDRGLLNLTDVDVLDTRVWPDGSHGRGLSAEQGGHLQATRCRMQGNAAHGLMVATGSTATLTDVVVTETAPAADDPWGWGIEVREGSTLRAQRCSILDNREYGIAAYSAGTEVHLSEVDVTNTRPATDGTLGHGIQVQEGATLVAENCLVENNAAIGVVLSGVGTQVTLAGIEIRSSRNVGIMAQHGASLKAVDCLIDDNTDTGIGIASEGTTVHLSEVVIRDTHPIADGSRGRGISMQDGALLEADHCLLENNAEIGLFIAEEDTLGMLRDVEVRGTRSWSNGWWGRGIEVGLGGTLIAQDCLVEDNMDVGIIVTAPGSSAQLDDVVVRGTRRGTLNNFAQGLTCQANARVSATGLVVEQTEGPGLFVPMGGTMTCGGCDLSDNALAGALVWAGGALRLHDTTIAGIVPDDSQGAGLGILVMDQGLPSTLEVDSSFIDAVPLAALWLEGDGLFDIRDSTVVGGLGQTMTFPDGSSAVLHGDAVVALDGGANLRFENNTIQDAPRVGLLLDSATATLVGNSYTGNSTDLVWQNCADVDEPTSVDEAPVVDRRCEASTLPIAPLDIVLKQEIPPTED
jgi:hypothetical protein